MTKNLITINQFIKKSLGEWKSIRSTHSLAFQEVENSTSKITIKDIEINNPKVLALLKKYDLKHTPSVIAISISWQAISDWEEEQKSQEDQTILLFLPRDKNTGIVLRNKGYTESVISSSEYLIDENSVGILNSDDDIINKVRKLIRSEFKSTFLKRPTINVHINRV